MNVLLFIIYMTNIYLLPDRIMFVYSPKSSSAIDRDGQAVHSDEVKLNVQLFLHFFVRSNF